MKLNYNLLTKYKLNKDCPLPEYPRPQLKRDSYLNLNGEWNFDLNTTGGLRDDFKEKIMVPYCVESILSGQRFDLPKGYYMIYSKEFIIEESFLKDITILHIDAVDQMCDIYLNEEKIGHYQNGYLPIEVPLRNVKLGKNKLDIVVLDDNSYDLPYGKQRLKRGGIWYTHVSGIWQSVWIESVSTDYIRSIKITPNIDKEMVTIEADSLDEEIKIYVYNEEKLIAKGMLKNGIIHVPMKNGIYWTPENPHLYHFTLETKNDKIESYFAYRKFSIDDKHFLLNNQPYFINGLLDQGYFSDGIYTPGDYIAYRDDILRMKEFGFNTLRKHIKIEPMMFYYYCDTLGMIVLQDMVNIGKYSFYKDSLLALAGVKKLPYVKVSEKQKENFIKYSKLTVKYLYNVPSIAYYTIFNEGWGQFDGDLLYDTLREIDSTRIYDSTSGWFRQTKSDVASYHIYFKPLKLDNETKPIFISEFGGYSYKDKAHSFNLSKTFGYKKFKTKEAFQDAFIKLYKEEVLPLKEKLAGIIYTQVSDVEDETNGILSYDREIVKLDKEKILPTMEEIKKI